MTPRLLAALLLALPASGAALAWDPPAGDWSKSHPQDLRVMTWNVADGICRTATKADASNDWNALVRIVAAMQPDVLIIQEAGDNSANGTGSGVDTVEQLTTTLRLFMQGGPDPFRGGQVGSYVQKFVPGYDLPHVFVGGSTDNFNRNVILSRYPFASVNGGPATLSDFVIGADAYAPGGNGGIRGFMFAQIDLPDDVYAGDAVVGNAHLKSGGAGSDFADRLRASQNAAYLIDHYFNGAGTGVSDPAGRVFLPSVGDVLDDNTPVIWGGDFNQQPGGQGPVEWMTRAEFAGGADGTDRDRSDSAWDHAEHPVSGETTTQGGSSKLDYLCWQDSVAQARRAFIFRSVGVGMTASNQPFPVSTFPNPIVASSLASDHRPVLVDLILPLAPAFPGCSPFDLAEPYAVLNFFDVAGYLALYNAGDDAADLASPAGVLNFFDLSAYLAGYNAGCP
jgi:endonuclease/exonuclease/phosphatase family metal-dependent hydrolase